MGVIEEYRASWDGVLEYARQPERELRHGGAFPLERGHLEDWILRSRGRDVTDGDEELPAR
ncbi:hypothetical protein, partial [Nonomuraea sp. NPDC049158]|uniref:hypothetical protein n=1 Tax=Nonomuraea sp. NPDC049158 TaxID=3155649 RepID=UPI0033D1F3EC